MSDVKIELFIRHNYAAEKHLDTGHRTGAHRLAASYFSGAVYKHGELINDCDVDTEAERDAWLQKQLTRFPRAIVEHRRNPVTNLD